MFKRAMSYGEEKQKQQSETAGTHVIGLPEPIADPQNGASGGAPIRLSVGEGDETDRPPLVDPAKRPLWADCEVVSGKKTACCWIRGVR